MLVKVSLSAFAGSISVKYAIRMEEDVQNVLSSYVSMKDVCVIACTVMKASPNVGTAQSQAEINVTLVGI